MDITAYSSWIGYIGSAFVLTSFMMKSVRKLRIVNSIGCVIFIFYGILLDFDLPIIITNAAIALLNFYYLFIKKD